MNLFVIEFKHFDVLRLVCDRVQNLVTISFSQGRQASWKFLHPTLVGLGQLCERMYSGMMGTNNCAFLADRFKTSITIESERIVMDITLKLLLHYILSLEVRCYKIIIQTTILPNSSFSSISNKPVKPMLTHPLIFSLLLLFVFFCGQPNWRRFWIGSIKHKGIILLYFVEFTWIRIFIFHRVMGCVFTVPLSYFGLARLQNCTVVILDLGLYNFIAFFFWFAHQFLQPIKPLLWFCLT